MVCDPRGVIQWADEHAEQLLGASTGMAVEALAAPGCEGALMELCKRGQDERLSHGWLDLRIHDRQVTAWCTAVSFAASATASAGTSEGWLALLATVVPEKPGNRRGAPAKGPSGPEAGAARAAPGAQTNASLACDVAQQRREIERLDRTLEERDQGIVALHAELDDKASAAVTSARIKSRAVAGVSHDLRTAIHSIMGLSKLLLDELDGPLSAEQKMQVGFIRTAADDLSQMTGDLLDLARLDTEVMGLCLRRQPVAELFGTLRGMLAPLLPVNGRPGSGRPGSNRPGSNQIELVFEPPPAPIELETDITKLSQILRHLIVHVIRSTSRDEVRVTATQEGDRVCFAVRDTGRGIALEHHERIFEELAPIHPGNVVQNLGQNLGQNLDQNHRQGLPLARKLARMLGGEIAITSHQSKGATFTVTIPAVHADAPQIRLLRPQEPNEAPENAPVLVVEADPCTVMRLEPYLAPAGFPVLSARTVQEARDILSRVRPAAIVLDFLIEGEASWRFLRQLENAPATRHTPVLVLTGSSRGHKARSSHKGELWLNAAAQGHLLRTLRTLVGPAGPARVLVVDGDQRSRYLVRQLLELVPIEMVEPEATEGNDTGELGALVQHLQPDAIVLGASPSPSKHEAHESCGVQEQLLDTLAADPRARHIPVVLLTPHVLSDEERDRLRARVAATLCRNTLASELAVCRIEKALQSPPAAAPGRSDHG